MIGETYIPVCGLAPSGNVGLPLDSVVLTTGGLSVPMGPENKQERNNILGYSLVLF